MANWLFICCGMVFTIVIVGAITRLADAGLSMVEWRPLMGILPPLNEQEWTRIFDLYKQSPEFQKKHFWMQISDFKAIFFWEWFHRLLGRLIGLVYALPLIWFWITNQIPKGYKSKLLAMLILGGLQGLMGWYMVKSGLVDQRDVSHYRLAAHLSLAFLIFALLLWLGLSLNNQKRTPHPALYAHSWIVLGLFILTVFWGAYTAGLDAGLIYNETFPKMGDRFLPKDIWRYEPFWINFFETHSGVQFTHRWLAIATTIMTLGLCVRATLKKQGGTIINALAIMIILQAGLGIATLFSKVSPPIAVLHQAGAVAVLTVLMINLYRLRP